MKQNRKIQKPPSVALQVVQWVLFFVLIAICYFIETSGSERKPLLLIPVALCIASHTEEISAMLTGMFCGLLLDSACGKLPGFNAMILVISCVLVSLLYRYFLRQKLMNMLILTAGCTFLEGYLNYLLYYALWDYEEVELIWEKILFPSCLMTIISTVIFYFLVKKIAETCGSHRVNQLEKTMLDLWQD